jgi:hypothetical protein
MRSTLSTFTAQFVVLGMSVVFVVACGGGGPVVTIAQLGALQVAVAEVQKAVSASIAQADDAAKNNINRVDTTAKDTLKRIHDEIDNAANRTAEQREEAARQAFDLLNQARRLVDDSGKDVFSNVNQALAAASATVDAIPFVKVPDTIYAVTPYKMRADAKDREVSVFGYFPAIAENANAVSATLNGEPVTIKRGIGRIFFDISEKALTTRQPTLDLEIQLPKKAMFSKSQTPIGARIRILSSAPYSFTVEAIKQNAAAYETMDGSARFETANSENTSRNVHLAATDLFNATVNNPKYDPATARIVNVREQPFGHGKACEDCPDPSGRVSTWNASAVEVALSAPNCSSHWVSKTSDGPFGIKIPGGYQCGGGGSHADVTFIPSFTAKVRGVPETLPVGTQKATAGWHAVQTLDLPSDWTSATVKLNYDDNFDKSETFVVVKREVGTAAAALFDVRIANDTKMMISTR